MAEEKSQEKWMGKVSGQLKGSKARDVWPLVGDFCSLHKWFPTIDTCHQVNSTVNAHQYKYCRLTVMKSAGARSNGRLFEIRLRVGLMRLFCRIMSLLSNPLLRKWKTL